MANDDFLVPAPRPFIEASIEIAEQPPPRRGHAMASSRRHSVGAGQTATLRPGGIRRGLWGWRRDGDVLDRLLDAVRSGESRVLVVRGEPGVGKTARLEYLVEHASGCRVARVAGSMRSGNSRSRRRGKPAGT